MLSANSWQVNVRASAIACLPKEGSQIWVFEAVCDLLWQQSADGEKSLKIGQRTPKLQQKCGNALFWFTVYISVYIISVWQ